MDRIRKGFVLIIIVVGTFFLISKSSHSTNYLISNSNPNTQTISPNEINSISLEKNSDIEKYRDYIASGSGTETDPYIFENLVIENNTILTYNEIQWNDPRIKYFGFGIHISGEFTHKVIIKNCTITGFRYGIFLENQKGIQLINNTIIYNYNIGILLQSSLYCNVSGNQIQNNRAAGILLYNNANYNQIQYNNCTWTYRGFDFQGTNVGENPSWGGQGLYLWNSCNNNTIIQNIFTENQQMGLKIGGELCTDNYIAQNKFYYNGFSYYEGRMVFVNDNNKFVDNFIYPIIMWDSSYTELLIIIGFLGIILIFLLKRYKDISFKSLNFKILIVINILIILSVIYMLISSLFYYFDWGVLIFIDSVSFLIIMILLFLFAETSKNEKVTIASALLVGTISILHLYNLYQYNMGLFLDKSWMIYTKFFIEFGVYFLACFYNFLITHQIGKRIQHHLRLKSYILRFAGVITGILLPIYILINSEQSPFNMDKLLQMLFIPIFEPNYILMIGWTIEAIIFAIIPEVTHVLLSYPSQMIVLDTERGIPIYSYNWEKQINQVNKALFSGMINGIRMFIYESMNGGDLQELKLNNNFLLLKQIPGYPIVIVLITKKSSKLLNDILKSFTNQFVSQFKNDLNDISDITRFKSTDVIIRKLFPFPF